MIGIRPFRRVMFTRAHLHQKLNMLRRAITLQEWRRGVYAREGSAMHGSDWT